MEKLFLICLSSRVPERIVWLLCVGLGWELEDEGDGEKPRGGMRGKVEMTRRRKGERREGKRVFEETKFW